MAGRVNLLSTQSYPYTIAWDDEDKNITIKPGLDDYDADLWEEAKELESVQKRLNKGLISEKPEGAEITNLEERLLRTAHDPSLIQELSVKAQKIPDNQDFSKADGKEAQLAQARKDIKQLQQIQGN